MSYTYIVTGANRGIGLALTQKILEKGDNVIAVCRNESKTKQLRSITDDDIRLTILIADVTNEKQLDNISSQVKYVDRIISMQELWALLEICMTVIIIVIKYQMY